MPTRTEDNRNGGASKGPDANDRALGEFGGRRVSVIGAARSGVASARALVYLGAIVTLSDSKQAVDIPDAADAKGFGAHCVFGAAPEAAIPQGTDLVVTSPGVPAGAPILREAGSRGIPIWSEVELAARLAVAPIVAVTGTNGKTTTAVLAAAMLEAAGKRAVICGNVSADEIKKTFVEAALEATDAGDLLVAEISSFQLEWVEAFAPRVGILTNVTADHLNRHASLEAYAQTKARLFAAQNRDDWAVIGHDNPVSREIGETGLKARRIWFTTNFAPPSDDACGWVKSGMLTARMERGGMEMPILPVSDVPPSLPGTHSVANVLAASLSALAVGAPVEAIASAVRAFRGVAHRMEWVADINGVRYVNNSMCTNVAAAICSLDAMDRPATVIAGGADKGLDFAPLVPALNAKAERLILIGTAADKMEATFRAGGYTAITRAESLESAVADAAKSAPSGTAVLLSPSCASFDMFRDFEARGAAFRAAVQRLKEQL